VAVILTTFATREFCGKAAMNVSLGNMPADSTLGSPVSENEKHVSFIRIDQKGVGFTNSLRLDGRGRYTRTGAVELLS
jgi:hypothetical protein